MASADLLYETFNLHLNKAKSCQAAGDYATAKKYYLLAAEQMLKLAKESTGDLQKARYLRAQNVIEEAKKMDSIAPKTADLNRGGNQTESTPNNPPAKKVSLEEALSKLNSLVGLETVKRQVNDWVDQIQTFKKRKERGLVVPDITYHMVFSGNPGTGKTTVARIMAEIYCALGVVTDGQLVEVSKPDLVAGHVGQTPIKTQEVLKKAYGGVLFVDEAYSLLKGGDFGQEAIDTMLKYMEDHRDNIVVIVAGYEKPIEKFISANQGLRSRFNNFIKFDDYTNEELCAIFEGLCAKNQYKLIPESRTLVRAYLKYIYDHRTPEFANGREVRNLFEGIVTRQSRRVNLIQNPTDEDMVTILPQDLAFSVPVEPTPTKVETPVQPTQPSQPVAPTPVNPTPNPNASGIDAIIGKKEEEKVEKPPMPEDKVLEEGVTFDSEFKFDWDSLPCITFDDVAGLESVKEAVKIKVLLPLKNPDAFKGYVKKSGGGLLLYGPPGTGKTMIAAAIANEIGAKFCSVKPSDLLHQGAGQSEKAIRTLFAQARQFKCAVIYFDEMDSISPKNTRSQYAKQLRSEFLSQLQGIESYGKDTGNILFLIAATNKPWDIDSAFIRPGRFGTRIYVGLPDDDARRYIVVSKIDKIKEQGEVKIADDIPYDDIVAKTEGYNGSDIANLMDEIQETSIIRGVLTGEKCILAEDFEKAFAKIKSSVQKDDIEKLMAWTEENN